MKIELKNLKIAAALSEETTAYAAVIYVDGVRAFHASNHGHGGCDFYQAVQGYAGPSEAEINAWLAANAPKISMAKYDADDLDCTLELFVGELIEQAERRQILDRYLRTKITVMVNGPKGNALATYPAKYKPTPENIAKVAKNLKPGEFVVNGNADLYAAALALV